uniref:Reverse transcriptase/retrotransposon-derived protein RNase H-like domain-containing protein n=1 Tax=Phytophthora ramorum TaxID=164328 RepID=H3H4R4_PHYRM
PEEELLLGKSTLQSIGVDLDGVFEQLAQQHIEAAEFEADDIPCEHMDVLGNSEDNEVDTLLHNMVDEAIQAGFEPAMADELRQMVLEYSDVFRVRLGRDEAADVQPLEVRLESGVQPYRSGVRRYPEAQRQFLREYVRELEDAGLVERNTQSRWACPALPVAKRGTDEFRITIDYRPVNRLTVPLAGAAPNLAVVTESVIDGAGVEHDPERLAALRQMPLPPTGAALQHFLCALNWLRDSMVDYARTTAPLQEKLEHVMQSRGRRKAQLSGAVVEWSKEEAETFRKTLEMIERSCKLAFPDKRATVCLFSDASLTGYALVLTQVLNWQDGVPVEEQQHELLICRGGLFKNAQRNWSIVEKEGYPIVKACGDLDYMLTHLHT